MLFNQSRARRVMADQSIDAIVATSPERGIAAITPGVRAAEIFRIVMETVRRVIPHFERSHTDLIGINNYDAPDLAPKSDEVIEDHMVTVVVRAHGAEPLTTLGNELRVV